MSSHHTHEIEKKGKGGSDDKVCDDKTEGVIEFDKGEKTPDEYFSKVTRTIYLTYKYRCYPLSLPNSI